MINNEKLDFWVKNNLNVLITGEHGVGKTAIVEETFQRNGLKIFDIDTFDQETNDKQMYYLYFSAATMDPYVDLIGVPREQNRDMNDGTRFTYLDLLRPLPLALDRIAGIIMDELNRADMKVRNAVMEIIQFKSINGKKFKNLRFVWGMINPETKDKTYDVERLDPAQVDRFHIHTEIDFKPDKQYFTRKFGEEQAKVALDWWNGIKPEVKSLCSPRRLDYAISIHNMGGSLRDVINKKLSVQKLEDTLKNGLAREKLATLIDQNRLEEAEEFLAIKNIFQEIEPWLIENKDSAKYAPTIFRLMNGEYMGKLLSKERKNAPLLKHLFDQYYTSTKISETISTIVTQTGDRELQKVISTMIPAFPTKNVGTSPIGFSAMTNANKTFSTTMANWAANSVYQDEKRTDEILKEMQNVPLDLSSDDAKNVIKVMGGLIKQVHAETLHARTAEFLGPLNHALKKEKLDMTKSSLYKLEINKLAKYKLEQHLWVPNAN